jgi:hypothetical protein
MAHLPLALSPADFQSLQRAREHLETPGFAVRLSDVIGTPIERVLKLLPRAWYRHLHRSAERAVWNALDLAVARVKDKQGQSSDTGYQLMGIASGALGGFFGGPALLLELPFTTSVMLQAIADIARAEGEDLNDIEARLACLQVFALGGRSNEDDAADTGYYGLRLALDASVSGATRHLLENGLHNRAGAPLLVDFIATLSQRFGVTLSEKAAAEIIPVIGALGGAFINSLFIQHFQDMAHSHFTLRRLERTYGPRLIRAEYARLGLPRPRLLLAPA